ncbi:MAG: ATP-binding protein [Methylococcaceae bacterium]
MLMSDISSLLISATDPSLALDHYCKLFEKQDNPVLLLKDGHIINCNAACLIQLGYPDKATFLNQSPADISPEFQADGLSSKEKANAMMAIAQQQGYHRFDWLHRCYHGELINVEITLTAIKVMDTPLLHAEWWNKNTQASLVSKLKASSALQDAIFNSRTFSSIATDNQGIIQIFNVGAETMLGYAASEVVNIMTPADLSDKRELFLRADTLSQKFGITLHSGFEALVYKAALGIEDIYELTYIGKNGQYIPAQVSVTALRDDAQSIIGYLLIGTDNTARKLMQQSRVNAAVAFESGQAMFITDAQGNYTLANKAYLDMTGYSLFELLGNNPRIMQSGRQSLAFYKHMWQTIQTEGHWSGALSNKRKNGDIQLELLSINKVSDSLGNTTHYVATFADNDQRLGYIKNVSINQEQANKLAIKTQLNQALQNNVTKAEQAVITKSQFLSNMSHEIRTPINAIISIAFLTLQTELSAQQQNYLSKIDSSAKWLLGILDDILNFSKLEVGKVELEQQQFELDSVLTFLKTVTTPLMANKDLSLIFELSSSVPRHFIGDSLRLGQVLLNLLSNAIKFTHTGTVTLKIQLLSLEAQQAQMYFSVTDTGIGLDLNQKNKLFEAFNQADNSTSRHYGGTGLGLTISKELVQVMGGAISIDSEKDVGSCFSFTITLPVAPCSAPTLAKNNLKHKVKYPSLQNARILVVEDNLMIQEFIPDIMGYEGMLVDLANNGVEALAMLPDNDYAAVLMDCQMPIMDGFETTQRIRANPRFDSMPIIAMTGNVDEHDRQRCLDCGMSEIINKPVDWEHAFFTLDHWLSHPRKPL